MKQTLIDTSQEQNPAFSGCSHGPAPRQRRPAVAPAVIVNGVQIDETAIAHEVQNHAAGSADEARAAAAHALVIRTLLLQRAAEMELVAAPLVDEAGREEAPEEALVRAVLDSEVTAPEPSEAECRRYYERAREHFLTPCLYEASHMLFEDRPGESGEQRARVAISKLLAGAEFSDVARAFSDCPSGAQGGSLGQLTAGDLAPEIEEALFALAPGQAGANPVRSRFGWHVIRLDRLLPGAETPFEGAQGAIREALRARAWVTAAAAYVDRLAQAASISGVDLSLGARGAR